MCSQTRNLGVHLPANLPIYVVMVTVLNEFGGNGIGTHQAGQGLLCASSEAVEQLPCLMTRVAKVDGCCAGLLSPASLLVVGPLQSVSSLIGVIAWGSPSKLVVHLLAVVIPSWYEGLSAAVRDGLFAAARMAEHQELYAVFGSEVGLGSCLAAVLRSSVKSPSLPS